MPSSDSAPVSAAPARRNRIRRLSALCLLPVALFLGGCVSEPSAITGQKQSFGYSWEQEVQLGAEADKEITAEMGLYQNADVQAYVEQIGQRVLQASNLRSPDTPELYRDTPFTFRVLDSPVVNAFALPGGYVYVTRGLLTHVQNEAQLAVVLGHEIAHVAARHSSQQARRAQFGQLGLMAAAILGQQVLGDQLGDNLGTLLDLSGQAMQLFMMRYSREAEHESDTLGVTSAIRAGYAASESAEFFQSLQRISQAEGRVLPTWQSTHPDPGDRANRVTQLAAATPAPAGTQRFVGEPEYLQRIEGMIVGHDPREGFTRNGVFYHPTLQFQFPVAPGWEVDNQKSAVVMGDPNGRAVMGLRLASGVDARDAANRFAQESKLQVVGSGATTINGLPAFVIVGQGQSEQGTLGVWNAFIELDNRVYSFMGLAPAQTFPQLRSSFERIASGFSPLRDPYAANVQPARLKLVRAEQPAPFASFVPASLPEELTADEVAIMNQVALNETVPAGTLLKVPDTTGQPGAAFSGQPFAPAPATVPYQPPQPVYVDPNAQPSPAPSYPSAPGYPQSAPTWPR